jgi:hypothetical protein
VTRTPSAALAAGRIWLLAALLALAGATGAQAQIEGFGTTTLGGSCSECVEYVVDSLDDDGPGTLRAAVSQGNRRVRFTVSGEIHLTSGPISVKGRNITIDGLTAPAPGITLTGHGLWIRGDEGLPSNLTPAKDVIVRGLRIRSVAEDGITVAYGAQRIVISHVSVWESGDGLIDITEAARDVTVAWSILAGGVKAMLIKYHARRVTLHHNIFVGGRNRNPQVSIDDVGTSATDTTLDMRNNLVYDWAGGAGTAIHHGAWANVVANFYSSPDSLPLDQEQALLVCHSGVCFDGDPSNTAQAFTQGNVSGDLLDFDGINRVGNESAPFLAPLVSTDDACTAARDTLAGAGARPLDAIDQQFLAPITLPACRRTTTALTATDSPTTLGEPVTFTATVQARPPAVGTPHGSVTFLKGTVALDTVPLVDGAATLVTPDLPQGTTTVNAVYSGDPDFDQSQDTLRHKVIGAPTSTTLTALPNPAQLGAPITLTATVVALPPSTATPDGSVRFFNGTRLLGTKPLAGGVATLVTSTLPAGFQTMKAQFMGNSGFAGSSSIALSLRIDGGTVTTLTRTPSSADAGQPVTFTAKVTAMTGAVTPTGTVAFRDGTALLATMPLVGGTAILTTSSLPVGKHEVTASYSGSTSFEPSVSSTLSTNVVKGGTRTTLTSTLLTLPQGQEVTFTVVVTPVAPAAGMPGGSLRFKDGAKTLATVNLSGGTAQFRTSALGLGSHSISVAYDGSTQFKTSLSNKITVKVTAP